MKEQSYLKSLEQEVHEGVAVRLDLLIQSTSNVTDQADGHSAEAGLFLVAQGVVQEWAK